MARPVLSWDEKWARMEDRFWQNTTVYGEDDCWPTEPVNYYNLGKETRYRPLALAWVLQFPERELPEPRHLYWIGNKADCTPTLCANPRHLAVKSNTPQAKASGVNGRPPNEPRAILKPGQALPARILRVGPDGVPLE